MSFKGLLEYLGREFRWSSAHLESLRKEVSSEDTAVICLKMILKDLGADELRGEGELEKGQNWVECNQGQEAGENPEARVLSGGWGWPENMV